MMEETKELREMRLVLQKSKKVSSSFKVHIGVFDNSQKGTNLTVQRFGMSNMFCKVTTRIFIAVECEQTPTSFPANVDSEHVPLTYEQQIVSWNAQIQACTWKTKELRHIITSNQTLPSFHDH
jgi:hypothetical protein